MAGGCHAVSAVSCFGSAHGITGGSENARCTFLAALAMIMQAKTADTAVATCIITSSAMSPACADTVFIANAAKRMPTANAAEW